MIRMRNLAPMLALGALTVLPACSMFGGNENTRAAAAPRSYDNSGNTTAAAAAAPAAAAATGSSGTVAPVSPGMIRRVQARLQQDGDYKGRIDGVWGPMTESGVRSWQQAHNVNANGEIDMATLQSMGITPDNQNADQGANNQGGTQDNAAATQPAGNQNAGTQNYSTGNNRMSGSNYSNNANAPAPASQGNSGSGMNNTGATGTANGGNGH